MYMYMLGVSVFVEGRYEKILQRFAAEQDVSWKRLRMLVRHNSVERSFGFDEI